MDTVQLSHILDLWNASQPVKATAITLHVSCDYAATEDHAAFTSMTSIEIALADPQTYRYKHIPLSPTIYDEDQLVTYVIDLLTRDLAHARSHS